MTSKNTIVMVSGGVDSMSLLHMLVRGHLVQADRQIIVAHVNHGIRQDSDQDEALVSACAAAYHVPFESICLQLGPRASEAAAREGRYAFAESLRDRYKAETIVTAHHLGDLLEGCILHLLRNGSYKGFLPFRRAGYERPLLGWEKANIVAYAQSHHLDWREDVSNYSTTYLRNYVRHTIVPAMGHNTAELLRLYHDVVAIEPEIDVLTDELLAQCLARPMEMNRLPFVLLPYSVQKQVAAEWLRQYHLTEFDQKLVERLVMAAKTANIHTKTELRSGLWLTSKQHSVVISKKSVDV